MLRATFASIALAMLAASATTAKGQLVRTSPHIMHHPPYLQMGPGAALDATEADQAAVVWQTISESEPSALPFDLDTFLVEYREGGGAWLPVPHDSFVTVDDNTGALGGRREQFTAEIQGLAWNTEHEYRVQQVAAGQVVNTYPGSFTTRPVPFSKQPFSFVHYGDSAGITTLPQTFELVSRTTAALEPAFFITNGDNAYQEGSHYEYDSRFTAALAPTNVELGSRTMQFHSVGNHDDGKGVVEDFAPPLPSTPFPNPNGDYTLRDNSYYSFVWGNVYFATWDANRKDLAYTRAALDWVEADYGKVKDQVDWAIIFNHFPIGGSPDKGNNPGEDYWQEMVARCNDMGIDLFLAGHTHTYHRSYPLVGVEDDKQTAIYVEEGEQGLTKSVYPKGLGLVQIAAGTGGAFTRFGENGFPDYVATGYQGQENPFGADPGQGIYGVGRVEVDGEASLRLQFHNVYTGITDEVVIAKDATTVSAASFETKTAARASGFEPSSTHAVTTTAVVAASLGAAALLAVGMVAKAKFMGKKNQAQGMAGEDSLQQVHVVA